MKRRIFTMEERKALYEKINSLRSSGVQLKDACAQAGIDTNQYYRCLRLFGAVSEVRAYKARSKTEPYVESIPVQSAPSQKIVCLLGSASEIAEVIKQWQA